MVPDAVSKVCLQQEGAGGLESVVVSGKAESSLSGEGIHLKSNYTEMKTVSDKLCTSSLSSDSHFTPQKDE